MENNYSVTKMKNKFNNQVTNKVKEKFKGLQNYLQKMYNNSKIKRIDRSLFL